MSVKRFSYICANTCTALLTYSLLLITSKSRQDFEVRVNSEEVISKNRQESCESCRFLEKPNDLDASNQTKSHNAILHHTSSFFTITYYLPKIDKVF